MSQPIEDFKAKFLAFARTHSGGYNWSDPRNCALGMFVKSLGYEGLSTGYCDRAEWDAFMQDNTDEMPMPQEIPYPADCFGATMPMRAGNLHEAFCRWEALVKRLEAQADTGTPHGV